MKPSIVERRRSVRHNVSPPVAMALAVSFPAQVVEISVSGVILGSKCEPAVGERGAFRATFGGQSLDVAIEIRGVSQENPSRGGPPYRIGGAFVEMTAEQHALLLELLGGRA
jgi:hypothetical protein